MFAYVFAVVAVAVAAAVAAAATVVVVAAAVAVVIVMVAALTAAAAPCCRVFKTGKLKRKVVVYIPTLPGYPAQILFNTWEVILNKF